MQKRAIAKTAQKYDLLLPIDKPIVPNENTPQQLKTSVDCGVAVVYIINQHFQQVPISKKEGEKELSKLRTHIVSKLLSWAGTRDFYAD